MSDSHSFIAELSQLALIRLGGEQRFEYLHGQLTVATDKPLANQARLSAHCDFKGKMFSTPVLSEYEDVFLLACHKESALHSLTQLKKYGVFSKVDISLASDMKSVGVAGEDYIKLLHVLFPDLSNTHLSVCSNEFGQAICFNDTSLRYLCHLSEKGIERLHDISEEINFVSDAYFERLEILAGIGNIQEATVGQFVPQMLNLHRLDAINFDKGCYMGQEVVARTKFLGKNKRATFIVNGASQSSSDGGHQNMQAGDVIEVKMGDSWRRGGTILRAAAFTKDSKTEYTGLVVMSNDTEVGSMVRLKDNELEMTVSALPYSLND
jgi:folate-binding protein YgfZ